MIPPRLRLILAWIPPLALMGLIFMMSSEPSYGEVGYLANRMDAGLLPAWLEPFIPWLDAHLGTIFHIGEFGLMALLLGHAFGQTPRLARFAVPLAWTTAVLYGISDEWHQSFVPGRSSTLADIIANTVGATLGITAWWLLVWWRKRVRANAGRPVESLR